MRLTDKFESTILPQPSLSILHTLSKHLYSIPITVSYNQRKGSSGINAEYFFFFFFFFFFNPPIMSLSKSTFLFSQRGFGMWLPSIRTESAITTLFFHLLQHSDIL
eukprot:TRINITY_DN6010_c0_g1_i4.p1 TRINITY_DN6010_c0_g1~~TRINITY_DN6010_c0_g1_i4.p1  ORF type:complete len:106 (+),score=16.36 TRINITY_DN6010_c0_g1_i4:436-753(+)